MYSDSLKQQTREYFKTMSFAAMKQFGGKFGIGVLRDEKYIITDRKTAEKYCYESMDALIKANWAVD